MDPLQYLTSLIEHERDSNAEFRDDMRVRMAALEQRFAIHDALAADAARKRKIYGGIVGAIVAVVSAVTPFLVN